MLLLASALFAPAFAAPPAIPRPMEIIEATIDGGDPQTIDPAFCYDTASGELLMNMYDTLVFFNGEHMDQYLPQLAYNWTITDITGTMSPEGLPWYFRYTFKMNNTAHFWNGDPVTAADVEYVVEREMVMDMDGGPQWMFYEPLLNTWGALGLNTTDLDGNPTEQARIGAMIDHAVESDPNGTVWFNLAFPGAYPPFLQILSQTWSSVYSKAWALGLGRASNWDGNFADWYSHHNPPLPPFDDPTPVAMGSGPFVFETLDRTLKQWSLLRNHAYFRGWPLDWPTFGGSKPAGYIEHYVVSWAWDWAARSAKFLAGEVDYCAVPRQYMGVVLNQPGIRCTYPLPSLAVDAVFYNQNVDPASQYGPIYTYGHFDSNGIPRDFFSDLNIRKAFSELIDYDIYIAVTYGGEAMQPPTAIIPGLIYYNASIPKYHYDTNAAIILLKEAFGGSIVSPGPAWATGFSVQLAYNQGNLARKNLCNMLAAALNGLGNPNIHATVTETTWSAYLYARDHAQLTAFILGWLADYPDAHNFAYAFYYTYGNFAWRASYSDAQMDALIEAGIRTPDGPERAAIYSAIQQRAIDTCPSVALDQAIGRHFERDWVVGWYYNPIYSGNYPANCWKWYYTPHAQLDNYATYPIDNHVPYDVNYDGKVDMKDIGVTAKSFGAIFGPPMSTTWVYRADFNNDRKIDMKDIGTVAKNFGKTSTTWTAGSYP